MIEQALAVQRVRLPCRGCPDPRELGGLAEGLGQLQVAGPGGEPDHVGEEVLELDLLRDVVERAVEGGERLGKRACS